MKVAIDTGPLKSGHKVRGIGVHTRELIEELKKLDNKGFKIAAIDFQKADLTKYDILHYPYFHPYFLTFPNPLTGGRPKTVVTIHDLILLIYPKNYPPGLKGRLRFIIQKSRIKKADAIVTISETSKRDIVRFLGVQSNKVRVIYLAPRRIFRKLVDNKLLTAVGKKYNLPKRFVLYVGDVNYNKNILGLIKACRLIKIPLVVVGKQALEVKDLGADMKNLFGPRDYLRYLFGRPHPELVHHKDLAREFDKEGVHCLDFVPDEDLVAIYNLATVYCQPSFYEGFGLPILEAMACSTPVVASKIQAHVEVAGGAATYANPKKPEDLANKIREIIDNNTLRQRLIEKGNKKAKEYSWEKVAEETLKVYKEKA